MKFASSEERPVLSFAPRVYTMKSDGPIKNLFVCQHMKTYSPNKGYVCCPVSKQHSYVVKYTMQFRLLCVTLVCGGLGPTDICREGGAGRPAGGNTGTEEFWGVPWASHQTSPHLPFLQAAQVINIHFASILFLFFFQMSYIEFLNHSPLLLFVIMLLLCGSNSSFPSRFVIGRSRGEAMADRRKDELNGYVWHLVHAAPEVAQVGLSAPTVSVVHCSKSAWG